MIEHIPDPQQLLQRLHQWLAPGGVLIVETPNAESPEHLHRRLFLNAFPQLRRENPQLSKWACLRKALTRAWGYIDPPRHIYGFTPKSLRCLIEHWRFSGIQTDNYLFRRSLYFPLSRLEREHLQQEATHAGRRLLKKSWLSYIAYQLLWRPLMALLIGYCAVFKRGIGLVIYARREGSV